ncbi:MAG: CapA family protein [Acidobacteriaceae bacterium]|nr:CapA family protein [Acidobacteriaceae bacterium]MBV9295675.1 CapA family protein [Acidobacteriaceae bacterium]
MRFAFCVVSLLCLVSCARVPQATRKQKELGQPAFNRLLFTGDVMFARSVRRQLLAAHDPALPFRKIAPLMAAADITFVNLESPFSDRGPYYESGLIFHAPPETIAGLNLAGVSIASTANNHSRDCGPHGVEFTIEWLRSHGIAPLGSGDSEEQAHRGVVLVRKGIRFGFLGYTFDQQNGNWRDIDRRIAVTDMAALCRDLTDLRKRADVMIVSMHNGVEYMPKPTKAQIAFAHAAIDAGATLVIGHHPHVIQPEEEYRGGLIFYSLGNFVFDQYQREATQRGEIVEISFLGQRIVATHVMPVRITTTGPELE